MNLTKGHYQILLDKHAYAKNVSVAGKDHYKFSGILFLLAVVVNVSISTP